MPQAKPEYPLYDFLNIKIVFQYLLFFALVLLAGWIGKDLAAILIITVILYYCSSKNLFGALNVWLVWFFCQGFYIGQNFIHNNIILNYVTKPSFVLLIIFLFFLKKISKRILKKTFLTFWMVFIFIALESSLYNNQMPFALITVSSFFLLYLLLSSEGITRIQCQSILNLFVAVGVLQTLVSLLQILHIIPPASKIMSDGFGGTELWTAALDDVASGTFGPDSSHVVSWYVSMIALFSILMWAITRRTKYIVIAVISIAQFATVDSKTVMLVMGMMMIYLIYYLYVNRGFFFLTISNLFKIFLTAVGLSLGLLLAWNLYYKIANNKYGSGDRANLSAVYKNEVSVSFNTISQHWMDWGKIQGFNYVFEDFLKHPIQIIVGYGLQGYNSGKVKYIESKDTPLMQSDDSTRSRSGLISAFATTGLVGLLLILISLSAWYRFNLKWCTLNLLLQKNNSVIYVTSSMIKIFSLFSLLLTFLYSFDLTSITIISFAGLIGVLQQYSTLTLANPYAKDK